MMSGYKNINKILSSPLRLRLFMLFNLPLAFMAGIRPEFISSDEAKVSAPYSFLTKNPFRSLYFAVQCMAAELSTGLLAINMVGNSSEQISMLVVNIQASFIKKSRSLTTFKCNDGELIKAAIAKSISTGEGQIVDVVSVGVDASGDKIAEFIITWSFKPKKIIIIG